MPARCQPGRQCHHDLSAVGCRALVGCCQNVALVRCTPSSGLPGQEAPKDGEVAQEACTTLFITWATRYSTNPAPMAATMATTASAAMMVTSLGRVSQRRAHEP